jgi:hypothetical protein
MALLLKVFRISINKINRRWLGSRILLLTVKEQTIWEEPSICKNPMWRINRHLSLHITVQKVVIKILVKKVIMSH